jgi:hypothetical protein
MLEEKHSKLVPVVHGTGVLPHIPTPPSPSYHPPPLKSLCFSIFSLRTDRVLVICCW